MNDVTPTYSLLRWLWSRKVAIFAGGAACAVVAFLYVLLATPHYKATVSLLPQSEHPSIGILSQIEMMSGLSLDSAKGNEELYGKIIRSDPIIEALKTRDWAAESSGDPVDLFDVLNVDADDANAQTKLSKAIRNEVVSFTRDRQTGYMEISATLPDDPDLAADFANMIVDELDHFNKFTRQFRAREQRVFLEGRELATLSDLRTSEDSLATFVKSNRSYMDSPLLQVEYNRLTRNVTTHSTVWLELRKQLELARVEENKDLMSVSVLSPAVPPSRPISPRLVRDVVMGFMLGCVLMVCLLALRDQRTRLGS